ncbi:S-layer homology domain-containing protein [Megasphaera elsdenii]|uniref:S-layer homology domain-containing protein n=1 Tax=Megasphaera elsdenii TaxID=907 RepID=UPI0014733363|nr:S-layer homology domain-containing protein [Megasphaera elsdenii]NME18627.1 hypothetical protein [Megasphaera elsdenii]
MKKSKKVLLSAAIAAAIMGSVSLPQVEAADIGHGVKVSASQWSDLGDGKYDVKTTDKQLNTTLATQEGLNNVNSELAGKANSTDIANQVSTKEVVADNVNATNVNAGNLSVSGKAEFNGTNGVSISDDLKVGGNVQVKGDTRLEGTTIIDNANVVNSNISNLSVSGKAEFNGTDGVSISDSLTVGNDTFKVDAESGITSAKILHGDQLTAGNATFDTTDANTTKTGTLTVTGNTRLEGTTLANEIGAGKVVSDEIEAGNVQAYGSLQVKGDARLEGKLTVGKIDNVEKAITDNQTAIKNETNDRVAADAKLSNRISDNSSAIQSLRHDVSDLGTEIDNVGAISAALAGLHPLDWNGSGSKFQLSAAAGTYDGKQAMALGGFYHPNRNMLLSLGVSSSLGSDRKTAGNVGITFRVGKGSNGTVSDDVAERLAAMDQKISQLESQNQKLTSMLAIVDPSLTKEFPDVPANHWAYEAVSKLAGNGIVEGYPDGDFHGDRTMTRYEMAQVIYKALKKGGTVDQKLVKEFNKEIEAVKANDAQ